MMNGFIFFSNFGLGSGFLSGSAELSAPGVFCMFMVPFLVW